MNKAYELGLFSRFGLSNCSATEVQAIHDHCTESGYILPTVYQGNYSAVARRPETTLFPTLRRLRISFYAYSPLAGGFFTKTKQQILDGAGRFSSDWSEGLYARMYARPSLLSALERWKQISEEVDCSPSDLAYRWIAYNSPLDPEFDDAVIIGSSRPSQVETTLIGLQNGPLPQSAVKAIDKIWEMVKEDAPVDNFSG